MAELTLQEKMRLKTSAEGRAASLANRDAVQEKYQSQIATSKPTVTAGSVTNAGSVANGGTAAKIVNNTPESQVLNQSVKTVTPNISQSTPNNFIPMGAPIPTSNPTVTGNFYGDTQNMQYNQQNNTGVNPVYVEGISDALPKNVVQAPAIDPRQAEIDRINNEAAIRQQELDQQRIDITNQLGEYKSPYNQEALNLIRQAYGNPFQYDPNADKSLRQAQAYAERQIMEQMNARGILNSTITRDEYASMLSEMVPKYESIAFERYNQNVDNLLKQANVLTQLSQDDYTRYRDFVTQSINTIGEIKKTTIDTAKANLDAINESIKTKIEKEKQAATERKNLLDYALKKLDAIGFVDNEISMITGLKTNTLSAAALKEINNQIFQMNKIEREAQIKMNELNAQNQLSKDKVQYEWDMKKEERDFEQRLKIADYSEKVRSNQASEGLRAESNAISQGNLENSRVNTSLRQQESNQKQAENTFKKSQYFDTTADSIYRQIASLESNPKIVIKDASGNVVKDYIRTPGSIEHKKIVTQIMQNPTLNDAEKTMILDDNRIPY